MFGLSDTPMAHTRLSLIRPARLQDAERLHEIAHAAYVIYVPRIGKEPAPMLADFEELIAQSKVWVLDGDPAPGYIVLAIRDGILFVDNVAVDPLSHGLGYGRELLQFAEDEAEARGILTIRLFTNIQMTENRSLYPSMGYREIGRRNEDGFDRVYFEKPLTS